MSSTRLKNEFIFKEVGKELKFIGDFEGLYKNERDPWGQSASKDNEMTAYYQYSRQRLVECLNALSPESILEVGCGLGYTTKIIQDNLRHSEVTGMDISKTAVQKAKKSFNSLRFKVGDISSSKFNSEKYDCIILNQLLWYILANLPVAFDNCLKSLKPGGKLILSQAFLHTQQRYGKDICDGFLGLKQYIKENFNKKFHIKYSDLDESLRFNHKDGIFVLKKI